jgi:hypothetical protein
MKPFDQLRELFSMQHRVISDKALSDLSKDLKDDPQFTFISPRVIRAIRKFPDKYISRSLITYVKLMDHEIRLSSLVHPGIRPKAIIEKTQRFIAKRSEEQRDVIVNAIKSKRGEVSVQLFFNEDGVKSSLYVKLPKGSNVLMSIIEHLDEEILLAKPMSTVKDTIANDRVREKRRRVNRKNQLLVS